MARAAVQAAVIRATVLPMSLKLLAGVRPQSKVDAGVRPQSKVASDCTLAPDPRPAGSTFAPDPGACGFYFCARPGGCALIEEISGSLTINFKARIYTALFERHG